MKLIPTFDLTDWGLCFNVFKTSFDYEYGIDIQILCFDLLIYFKERNKILYVAVITKYKKEFDFWVKENQKTNEKYIFVSRDEDIIGRRFDEIKIIYGFDDLEAPYKLLENCKLRLLKNNHGK
jgi:hypothetical protein